MNLYFVWTWDKTGLIDISKAKYLYWYEIRKDHEEVEPNEGFGIRAKIVSGVTRRDKDCLLAVTNTKEEAIDYLETLRIDLNSRRGVSSGRPTITKIVSPESMEKLIEDFKTLAAVVGILHSVISLALAERTILSDESAMDEGSKQLLKWSTKLYGLLPEKEKK